MAKQSIETKARNAVKAKAKGEVKAKLTDKATGKVAETLQSGKVITIEHQAGTKGKKPVSNSNLPMYGAELDPATDGNKRTERKYLVNDNQMSFVQKLINSDLLITTISSVGHTAAELQFEIACVCAALAYRLQMDFETNRSNLIAFFDELERLGKGYTMIRTNSIKQWFEAYAPVKYAKPNVGEKKTWLLDSKKQQRFAGVFKNEKGKEKFIRERLQTPFWIFKPEQDYKSFVLMNDLGKIIKELQDLKKRAHEVSGMSEDQIKEHFGDKPVDVSGLEILDTVVDNVVQLSKKKKAAA